MRYEKPILKIIEIDVTDIIQTSGTGGENETPPYIPPLSIKSLPDIDAEF